MIWLILCALPAAAGCGSKAKEIERIVDSPIAYHSHLTPGIDLAEYETWNYLSPLVDEKAIDKARIEPGIRTAIESAIDTRMRDRAYRRVASSPDLVINYHVAGKEIDGDYIKRMYDGTYYPKYRVNFDGPRSARNRWEEGSIIIFIFDPATGDMVWRSTATAEVTSAAPLDRRVERLNEAVKMMFTSLPGK